MKRIKDGRGACMVRIYSTEKREGEGQKILEIKSRDDRSIVVIVDVKSAAML